MVGHFLHPHRKSRGSNSSQGSNASGSTQSSAGSSTRYATTPSHLEPHTMPAITNYSGGMMAATTAVPTGTGTATSGSHPPPLPYMPPQNLSAEAVAALPPPGTCVSCWGKDGTYVMSFVVIVLVEKRSNQFLPSLLCFVLEHNRSYCTHTHPSFAIV